MKKDNYIFYYIFLYFVKIKIFILLFQFFKKQYHLTNLTQLINKINILKNDER